MQIIDGQSVHPAVAVAYGKLAAAFKAATGKELRVSSGHRTTAEQTALFLSRYRLQSTGGGTYGDIRWWQGRRYVRVSAAGTVAVPGTSLHESLRALDVRDTGADAGVTVAGTVRANWLRANAPRFEFNPRGYNFKEPWHIEFTGSLTTPAGTGADMPLTQADIAAIWSQPVHRGGEKVSAIQELADAKTYGIQNAARLAALETAVKALGAKQGVDPVKLTADINAAVKAAVSNLRVDASLDATDIEAIAEAVVTEQAERLLN